MNKRLYLCSAVIVSALLSACNSGVNVGGKNTDGNNNQPPQSLTIDVKPGAKTFRQVRTSLANIAGVPLASNPNICSTEYTAAKSSLAVNNKIDSLSVAAINATEELARCYGTAHSTRSAAIAQYAPIDISLPAAQALTPTLVDQYVHGLVLASFGPGNHADLESELKSMIGQLTPLTTNTSSILSAAFSAAAIGVLKY